MEISLYTYRDSFKFSIIEMAIEKIDKFAVIVCEVLEPIELLTTIELYQLLLEFCIAVDSCMKNTIIIIVH